MKDKRVDTQNNSPFVLFKNGQFTWLLSSNFAFFFAMQAQMATRAWLAFKLTESELALGMVMFAIAVPMFFLSPLGGVMADKKDRRNLIILGQFSVFTTDLLMLILLFTDSLEFWHLLSSAAIIGCAFPFIMPARNAIVVNVVGKSKLEHAIAINMGGVNMARVLGPASAGFLIDLAGVTNAYLMGVSLYGLGLLFMTRVGSSKPDGSQEGVSPKESILEGVTYMRQHRLVLILLLFGLVPMFLAMPFQNLIVVFAEKVWQVGPRGFGLLGAAVGVGGIVGSLWVVSIKNTNERLKLMMVSVLSFGGFLFCFSLSPYFLLGLVLVFLANVFGNVFSTLNNTAIQLLIPDRVRGRISSFLMMSFSLPLLGTLPVSAVAEAFGAPVAVGLASILAILTALLFFGLSPNLR
ncbi:MAG: MFS transporter, partial [SAR324 cluster bacterium]|nr:MFS transporter [SAR324 cluster bacterium]